jgi:hypothetical protein
MKDRSLSAFNLCQNRVSGGRPEFPADPSVDARVLKLIERCWDGNPQVRPSFNQIFKALQSIDFRLFPDVDADVVKRYAARVLDFEKRPNSG